MFWGDDRGLPRPYKGWKVVVAEGYGNKSQFPTACARLFQWLQMYMHVDTVTLLLPVQDQQNLAVHATIGLEEEIVQQIRIPIGQGIAGRIAESSKPMIINDVAAVEVFSPILRQKELQSLVGVPVPINQGMVGVLHVGTLRRHQFSERDIQQLQLAAHRLQTEIAEVDLFNWQQDTAIDNKVWKSAKIWHVLQAGSAWCKDLNDRLHFKSRLHQRIRRQMNLQISL